MIGTLASDLRQWMATADTAAARMVRRMARTVLRGAAVARSGSVSARMDHIVAEANAGTTGAARPTRRRTRSDTSRTRP